MSAPTPISLRAALAVGAFLVFTSSAAWSQAERLDVQARSVEPAAIAESRQASGAGSLVLRSGIIDPTTQRLAVDAYQLVQPTTGYGLVQFEAGVPDAARRLTDAGIEVLAYQPDHAWLVRWTPERRATADTLDGVRWSGDFSAEMKLAPELLDRTTLPMRSVPLADGSRSPLGATLELLGFPGVDARTLADAALKFNPAARLVELGRSDRWPTAVIWTPEPNLQSMVERLTGVAGLYQLSDAAPLELHNRDSVEPIQANTITGNVPPTATPMWDQDLIGTGQIVAVMDSGLDNNEDWFVGLDSGSGPLVELTDGESPVPPATGTTWPDRKVYAYWVQPGATAYDNNQVCTTTPTGFHGTHVAGTVAGDSPNVSSPTSPNYDDGDGMAPNAQILFQDVGNDNSGCLSITDLYSTLQQAAAGGASIHTNSWGAAVNGTYTANSAAVDAFTRFQEQSLVMFSAGNSGPGADTIGAPATSKNVLTVGALQHGNNTSVVSFSSRGPTDDGRIKPDIQAPGTSIRSAAGDTVNNGVVDPGSISTKSGTSMSAPTVAGGTALLRQYFTDGFYPTGIRTAADQDIPSGALMKAALLNGTLVANGYNVPSNTYGWGRIWLDNNLFFSGDSRYMRYWDRSHATGLTTGQQHVYSVDLQAGEELRITLAWSDVPAAVGAGVTLVNDLDLEVTAPGATVYRGNVFTGSASTTGGSFDRLNPVEQVRLTAPQAGTYQIRVIGHAVPGDGSTMSDRQGYGLVLSAAAPASPVLSAPTGVTATDQGAAGVQVTFNPVAGASGYNIYRATGDCAADALDFVFAGHSATTTFIDDQAIGGFEYSYRVRAENGASEGPVSSCGASSVATSTAACNLRPVFDQALVSAADATGNVCAIELSWSAGSSNCPAAPDLRYNVYRSTDPFFTPGPASLHAADFSGTSYTDFDALPETTYYYVVRAEDSTDPVDGNESTGALTVKAASVGDDNVAGTFTDGADGLSLMVATSIWSVTDDAAATGVLSYRSALDGATSYTPNTCATITTPPIDLQAGSPQLSFDARYEIEADWDGVVLEISTDGGANWAALTPTGGYPGDFSQTQNPPINACGYPTSQGAFNGTTGGAFVPVSADLSGFAGQTVQLRWVLSTDPGEDQQGFFLDNVEITDASVPAACFVGVELFADGFESP